MRFTLCFILTSIWVHLLFWEHLSIVTIVIVDFIRSNWPFSELIFVLIRCYLPFYIFKVVLFWYKRSFSILIYILYCFICIGIFIHCYACWPTSIHIWLILSWSVITLHWNVFRVFLVASLWKSDLLILIVKSKSWCYLIKWLINVII